METHDQQNEYLKSVVIPVPVLERSISDSQRNQTLEYYVRVKDENNPNTDKPPYVEQPLYEPLP